MIYSVRGIIAREGYIYFTIYMDKLALALVTQWASHLVSSSRCWVKWLSGIERANTWHGPQNTTTTTKHKKAVYPETYLRPQPITHKCALDRWIAASQFLCFYTNLIWHLMSDLRVVIVKRP